MSAWLSVAAALDADAMASPSPGAAEIERMNRIFEQARQVRVVTTSRGFEVTRPHALEAGLDYRATPGFRLRRPAIVAGQWDTLAAPPRPVPWETIQKVEWRHGGTGTGVIAGVIGAALLVTGVAIAVNRSGSDVAPSILGIGLGSAAGGTLIGLVAAGMASRTETVYPQSEHREH